MIYCKAEFVTQKVRCYMCMSFYALPCGFDPAVPFQPSQTDMQFL